MSPFSNSCCTEKEESVPLEDISTDQTRPKPNNTPKHDQTFHPFPLLPTELRLQIWRLAAEEACRHGKVHRVRLELVADTSTNHNNDDSKISPPPRPIPILLPTPSLILSTHATRTLLTVCFESRSEILNGPSASHFLPDKIILRTQIPSATTGGGAGGGQARGRGREREGEHERVCGILHCSFSRDVILLENISSDLLIATSESLISRSFETTIDLGPLRDVENLCLDFLEGSEAEAAYWGMIEWNRKPECDRAIKRLAGGLPKLRGVWVCAGPGRVGRASIGTEDEDTAENRGSGDNNVSASTSGVTNTFELMDDEDSEMNINWYRGQYAGVSKPEEWWRRVPYHELLRSLEQVAISLGDMLHLPPSYYGTESEAESGGVESSPAEETSYSGCLRRVQVGVLGQFGSKWCFKTDMTMSMPLLGRTSGSLMLPNGEELEWDESHGLWNWRLMMPTRENILG